MDMGKTEAEARELARKFCELRKRARGLANEAAELRKRGAELSGHPAMRARPRAYGQADEREGAARQVLEEAGAVGQQLLAAARLPRPVASQPLDDLTEVVAWRLARHALLGPIFDAVDRHAAESSHLRLAADHMAPANGGR